MNYKNLHMIITKGGFDLVRHSMFLSLLIFVFSTVISDVVNAEETPPREEIIDQRMTMYVQFQNHIVPWYHLAAILTNMNGIFKLFVQISLNGTALSPFSFLKSIG